MNHLKYWQGVVFYEVGPGIVQTFNRKGLQNFSYSWTGTELNTWS